MLNEQPCLICGLPYLAHIGGDNRKCNRCDAPLRTHEYNFNDCKALISFMDRLSTWGRSNWKEKQDLTKQLQDQLKAKVQEIKPWQPVYQKQQEAGNFLSTEQEKIAALESTLRQKSDVVQQQENTIQRQETTISKLTSLNQELRNQLDLEKTNLRRLEQLSIIIDQLTPIIDRLQPDDFIQLLYGLKEIRKLKKYESAYQADGSSSKNVASASNNWSYIQAEPELLNSLEPSNHPVDAQSGTESLNPLEPSKRQVESQANTKLDSRNLNLSWLNEYNQTRNFDLAKDRMAIEVAATEDSLGDRWLAREKPVIFEEGTGSYWLIKTTESAGYLVPNKQKFRFNEHNLDSIQICFDLNQAESIDPTPFDPSQFTLPQFEIVYPAHMSQTEEEGRWQLDKRGLIKFPPKELIE